MNLKIVTLSLSLLTTTAVSFAQSNNSRNCFMEYKEPGYRGHGDSSDRSCKNTSVSKVKFGPITLLRSTRYKMCDPQLPSVGEDVYADDIYTYIGKFMGITDDEKVSVKDRLGKWSTVNPDDLIVTNGCDNVFCVGDYTSIKNGKNAVVYGFNKKGKILVLVIEEGYNRTTVEQSELLYGGGCTDRFCTDDKVILSSQPNTIYHITGFYGDGSVSIFNHKNFSTSVVHTCDLALVKRAECWGTYRPQQTNFCKK